MRRPPRPSPDPARRDLHERHPGTHGHRQRVRVAAGERGSQPGSELAERQRRRLDQRPSTGRDFGAVESGQPRTVGALQPAVQHGLQHRAQREAVRGRDQVDRRPHEGDPHDPAVEHQIGELGRREALDPAPQPEVRGVRGLRLHPDQVCHGVDGAAAVAAQQQLPGQQRPVQRAPGEHGSGAASRHPGILAHAGPPQGRAAAGRPEKGGDRQRARGRVVPGPGRLDVVALVGRRRLDHAPEQSAGGCTRAGSRACSGARRGAGRPGRPGRPVAPVAPVAEPAAYVGDPRFGGPATVPMPSQPATPAAAAYGPVPGGRPTSHLVVAGAVALVLLVVAVLVGKSVLGGSGSSDSADPSGLTGGLLGAGNPQVAAMKADVLHIATTEETLYTERQLFVAGASGKGALVLGGQSVRLSSPGEAVQVVLSPSGVGYCIRAARTPAGGGAPQVVLYVSTQGGLQPPQVTSCPAAF